MNPYTQADIQLNGRPQKRVANNTVLRRDTLPLVTGQSEPQRAIRLRLHQTDILTFLPDGSTVATSGGWKTATTKDRLNSWLPHGWRIAQDAGAWYWLPPRTEQFDWSTWKAGRILFTDGDAIGPRGALRAQARSSDEAKQKKMRRRVLAFARLCADAVPMPAPGAGDCFYCQMVVSSPAADAGKTLGDATGNPDHILSHMEEGYAVPSLVYRALKEAGANQFAMAGAFGQAPGFGERIARRDVRSAVASFVFRRLGMVARGGWASGSPVSGYKPHCAAV